MTLDEWIEIEGLIAAAWPHARPMSRGQVEARHRIVEGHDQAVIAEAVEWFAKQGERFPPGPGELHHHIASKARTSVPGAAETLRLIGQAIGAFGDDREADGLRWLAERSSHAARAVVDYGWRELGRERTADPDHGGAVRARVERTIAGSIGAMEDERREQRALPRVRDRIAALERRTAAGGGLQQIGERLADVVPIRRQLDQGRGDVA
ncbi:MAG: hypothetical protein M0P31_17040 [Solirubrobacteraceae bacterium]|nr:hypothetical protein [Solirubrobacteraceae bacterium]